MYVRNKTLAISPSQRLHGSHIGWIKRRRRRACPVRIPVVGFSRSTLKRSAEESQQMALQVGLDTLRCPVLHFRHTGPPRSIRPTRVQVRALGQHLQAAELIALRWGLRTGETEAL